MTEEELNGPQIGARFEEMYSECVSKRMWCDRFGETGQTVRLLAGCFYGVLRDRPIVMNAWEQPLLRSNGSPVAAQDPRRRMLSRKEDLVPRAVVESARPKGTLLAISYLVSAAIVLVFQALFPI